MNTILILITSGIFCITVAVLFNHLCDWIGFGTKAPMLPPPFPDEPKASVSAAEFFAQAKLQRAERETAEVIEAPKKKSKPISLVLCAMFAFGTIAGSIGGYAASNRYQLMPLGNNVHAAFRVDRLTGKTWLVSPSQVRPIKEQP